MRLAFTTLGCPDWNLNQIIAAAKADGYDGIDFRGYLGNNNLWETPPFAAGREDTARKIRAAGLEIPCFSSSIRLLCGPDLQPGFLEEARTYIELCRTFGTRFIRVFGGYMKDIGTTDRSAAADTAAAFLDQVAAAGATEGIRFLVETHDDWIAGRDLRLLLDRAAAPNVGAIWDIHHPFRLKNEPLPETWEALGPYVHYLHIKDSFVTDKGHQLCLPGAGDIPIKAAVDLLKNAGYDGYLAFEWEKKWHPEIEEPETAFPVYARLMHDILKP